MELQAFVVNKIISGTKFYPVSSLGGGEVVLQRLRKRPQALHVAPRVAPAPSWAGPAGFQCLQPPKWPFSVWLADLPGSITRHPSFWCLVFVLG